MPIPAGQKNRRLILQSRDASTGDYAEVIEVWGKLAFIGGSPEALRSGAPLAIAQWKMWIDYRSDVKAEWRVIDKETAKTFQLSGYGDPDGQKFDLEMIGTEVQ